MNSKWHTGKRIAIEYAAKLNVPLLPKQGTTQIVLGTTKYLLPYTLLPKYFKLFVVNPHLWSLESNLNMIECIGKQFIHADIIRFVTTPEDLIDKANHYRITAEEICIFKKYNYKFYKYNSKEFNNIYFCSKTPLVGCHLVTTTTGSFKCKGQQLGNYLYF